MYARAREVLSGGVASSYQLREPWRIYLEHGEGPRVWDLDGNDLPGDVAAPDEMAAELTA